MVKDRGHVTCDTHLKMCVVTDLAIASSPRRSRGRHLTGQLLMFMPVLVWHCSCLFERHCECCACSKAVSRCWSPLYIVQHKVSKAYDPFTEVKQMYGATCTYRHLLIWSKCSRWIHANNNIIKLTLWGLLSQICDTGLPRLYLY